MTPQESTPPPIIDRDLVRKFGHFVVEAVPIGRGDEIIDPARTAFSR